VYYDNGSVNYELDQWELDDEFIYSDIDSDYLSVELEQGELE
jgi:hypothetical protein